MFIALLLLVFSIKLENEVMMTHDDFEMSCHIAHFCKQKLKLSDYLYIKRLFIDFQGGLKETCVQRSPCI